MKDIIVMEKPENIKVIAKSKRYVVEKLDKKIYLSYLNIGLKIVLLITEDIDIAVQIFCELISY